MLVQIYESKEFGKFSVFAVISVFFICLGKFKIENGFGFGFSEIAYNLFIFAERHFFFKFVHKSRHLRVYFLFIKTALHFYYIAESNKRRIKAEINIFVPRFFDYISKIAFKRYFAFTVFSYSFVYFFIFFTVIFVRQKGKHFFNFRKSRFYFVFA